MRRLVSGVRNSWPASCTSWVCSWRLRASAPSIPLNATPSWAVSSSPSVGTSTSSRPVEATSAAASVRRSKRRVSWRPSNQPTIAEATSAIATAHSVWRRIASSELSVSRIERASWIAPPVADGTVEDAVALAVDHHVVAGVALVGDGDLDVRAR